MIATCAEVFTHTAFFSLAKQRIGASWRAQINTTDTSLLCLTNTSTEYYWQGEFIDKITYDCLHKFIAVSYNDGCQKEINIPNGGLWLDTQMEQMKQAGMPIGGICSRRRIGRGWPMWLNGTNGTSIREARNLLILLLVGGREWGAEKGKSVNK